MAAASTSSLVPSASFFTLTKEVSFSMRRAESSKVQWDNDNWDKVIGEVVHGGIKIRKGSM